MNFLIVFVGGGLGSVTRYAILLIFRQLSIQSLWATLFANILACFIIGILTALSSKGSLTDAQRLLFAIGFCGGFSTFSTFSNETWALMNGGQMFMAFLNIALSLVLCLAATFVGLKLAA